MTYADDTLRRQPALAWAAEADAKPDNQIGEVVYGVVDPAYTRVSSAAFSCYAVVAKRLEELIRLPAGWDGYKGSPVGFHTAYFAIQLLNRICNPSTPAPAVIPSPSGGLQFEWATDDAELEIYIKKPYDVEALAVDLASGKEEEFELKSDFTPLLKAIKKLQAD